jgi:hypothetical protein
MEPITEPHASVIMYTPLFRPEDVLLVETFLTTDQIYDLLFLYCRSHATGSYAFFDEMATLTMEYEWPMNVELSIVDAVNRMASVLYYALAINPVLCILLIADVYDVHPMANNSLLVRYLTEGVLDTATTFNIGVINEYGFSPRPSDINYPNATPGSCVSDILS